MGCSGDLHRSGVCLAALADGIEINLKAVMIKRSLVVIVALVLLALALLLAGRSVGKAMEQKHAATGDGLIIVRELQRKPFSVAGLLGVGDSIYRCEYVPHPGWPVVSAISLVGESYTPTSISIEWNDFNSAKVSFDTEAVFYLANGIWRVGEL
mgnify:CR=1 FL=1